MIECPYCKAPAVLVTGREIYPHLPRLYSRSFYRCAPCDAYVGCHEGTTKPFGRLANAELRRMKQATHRVFDPLWRDGRQKRKEAYRFLADRLGIPFKDCHIGMFDVETCRRAIEICVRA